MQSLAAALRGELHGWQAFAAGNERVWERVLAPTKSALEKVRDTGLTFSYLFSS